MPPLTDQRQPPPTLEQLSKLQLMRSSLVNFIDWKDFNDVVVGCYVRVLLEMRVEDRTREAVDNYYITCVKGTKKGPSYSGFSCEGATTEWHIVIELPTSFRATANGNVVQLNSISNSPFNVREYQAWMASCREANHSFLSAAQLDFRLKLLQEHKQQAMTPAVRKRRAGEDPAAVERREAHIATLRREITDEIKATHAFLPHPLKLRVCDADELQEVERKCLDLISKMRVALNEKSKCLLCQQHVSTVVCYPCKHQVLCSGCIDRVDTQCPAPGCNIPVSQKFATFNL